MWTDAGRLEPSPQIDMGFSGIGIALQDTRHFKTGLPKGVDDLFANFEGFVQIIMHLHFLYFIC